MPIIETVDEIAEEMADKLGIYEASRKTMIDEWGNHDDQCDCRMCFVSKFTERLRGAVRNEGVIAKTNLAGEQEPGEVDK